MIKGEGTLVLDEVVCHIQRIWLEDGAIWFAFHSDLTTVKLNGHAEVTIFASDGSVVLHAPSSDTSQWTSAKDGYVKGTVPVRCQDGTAQRIPR